MNLASGGLTIVTTEPLRLARDETVTSGGRTSRRIVGRARIAATDESEAATVAATLTLDAEGGWVREATVRTTSDEAKPTVVRYRLVPGAPKGATFAFDVSVLKGWTKAEGAANLTLGDGG